MSKKLCECGCGQIVKPGNSFIYGHNGCKTPWKPKPEPQLCQCGCGGFTEPGKRFIHGHSRCKTPWKPKPEPQLCECGCGDYAKPGRRFINHHNTRTEKYWEPQPKSQLCACGCGNYANPGRKYIMGHNRKNIIITDNIREKNRVGTIKYFENPINHEKASAAHQGIPYDEWESFASELPYCPDFNEECRESNREKYGRKCFLTGLPESENITENGGQWKLSVHHVDMNKGQGCDGIRWKLVPICLKWHGRTHNGLWEARIIWLLDNVWNKD